MNKRNVGGSLSADTATRATIDWPALEELAQRLGPRTRGLIATRNEIGLRSWLAYAVKSSESWPRQIAALYRELAGLVGIERGAVA